ncbi:MAG: PIN domain-containing protein [Geminicoccaceae bacterium]
MRTVFVDTSAWFALVDGKTSEHREIVDIMRGYRDRLVTSDYVFDETVTLLRSRRSWSLARKAGELLRSGAVAKLVRLGPDDIEAAWSVFCSRPDQRLSFTDCTSFVLMRRLEIETAISLDDDFRALGLTTLP